eukprot:CAMPEP_0175130144 /NCGR_PEP_ID=MMETSP0087-20121206/5852_1 /TAXON_ID=136419 /ORGANISM="Unknown Unknown, Strain D1" /LENGTH=1033 /DNA_ID=CAMNT_0016412347 /DNA_START=43 /DNA_END=3143 /DNA_ORIENTATION=+
MNRLTLLSLGAIAHASGSMLFGSIGEGFCRDKDGLKMPAVYSDGFDETGCQTLCSALQCDAMVHTASRNRCILYKRSLDSATPLPLAASGVVWTGPLAGDAEVKEISSTFLSDASKGALCYVPLYVPVGSGFCRDAEGRTPPALVKTGVFSLPLCRSLCDAQQPCFALAFNSALNRCILYGVSLVNDGTYLAAAGNGGGSVVRAMVPANVVEAIGSECYRRQQTQEQQQQTGTARGASASPCPASEPMSFTPCAVPGQKCSYKEVCCCYDGSSGDCIAVSAVCVGSSWQVRMPMLACPDPAACGTRSTTGGGSSIVQADPFAACGVTATGGGVEGADISRLCSQQCSLELEAIQGTGTAGTEQASAFAAFRSTLCDQNSSGSGSGSGSGGPSPTTPPPPPPPQPVVCPASAPEPSTSCAGFPDSMTCEYDVQCCCNDGRDNDCSPTMFATCTVGEGWMVAVADMFCNRAACKQPDQPPPTSLPRPPPPPPPSPSASSCPAALPSSSSPCSTNGLNCEYDVLCCCNDGSEGDCKPTAFATCSVPFSDSVATAGQWMIVMAGVFCPPDKCDKETPTLAPPPPVTVPSRACPASVPLFGSECAKPGQSCPYNEVCCCNDGSDNDCQATTFATCSGEGGWVISAVAMNCQECGSKPTLPPPACVCPAIYQPVCANGIDYANNCEAQCAGSKLWDEGTCSSQPLVNCICAEIWKPVCVDGLQFGNACEAECQGFSSSQMREGLCGDVTKPTAGNGGECPVTAPPVGSPCWFADLRCEYDVVCCCNDGRDGDCKPTTFASCSLGFGWQVAMAGFLCPATCDKEPQPVVLDVCPLTQPSPGDSCPTLGQSCDYDVVCCCGDGSANDCNPTSFATCAEGGWMVAMSLIQCPKCEAPPLIELPQLPALPSALPSDSGTPCQPSVRGPFTLVSNRFPLFCLDSSGKNLAPKKCQSSAKAQQFLLEPSSDDPKAYFVKPRNDLLSCVVRTGQNKRGLSTGKCSDTEVVKLVATGNSYSLQFSGGKCVNLPSKTKSFAAALQQSE